MFDSAYCWQIRHLVSSLNTLNNSANIEEINQITMSMGENGRTVLMSSLLDEIDFREGAQKDPTRGMLLNCLIFWLLIICIFSDFTKRRTTESNETD